MSSKDYEPYLKKSVDLAEKRGFRTDLFISLHDEDECLLAFEKECVRMLYEIPNSTIHVAEEGENQYEEKCITFLSPDFRCWVAVLKEDRSPYFGAISSQ